MTKNGRGTRCGTPSAVTWRSSITSSSADCVFGLARLISSPISTLVNTGPWRKENDDVRWSNTITPVTSLGRRSGVNCTRFHDPAIEPAIALAIDVLPVPGTSSISRWPSVSRQHNARRIDSALPRTILSTLSINAWNTLATWSAMAGDAIAHLSWVRVPHTSRRSELDVVLNFEVISWTCRTDNKIMRPVSVPEPAQPPTVARRTHGSDRFDTAGRGRDLGQRRPRIGHRR